MKTRLGLFVILTLLLTACYIPTPTPPPVTPTPPPATTVPALFADDFSDPAGCWVTLDDADGRIVCQDGALLMDNYGAGTTLFAGPGREFDNAAIAVDVTWRDGSQDNWMGIACRMQDNGDSYVFLVSADGFYLLARYADGTPMPLDGPTASTAIHTGAAANHLRAECAGPTLRLWVNDTLVSEQSDAVLTSGEVGLLLDAADDNPTGVSFDNFVVQTP